MDVLPIAGIAKTISALISIGSVGVADAHSAPQAEGLVESQGEGGVGTNALGSKSHTMPKRVAMGGAPGTTEQAVHVMSNWCRAQQDDEKQQLMHALEQLKNDIRLDTETKDNWEAAMHVNVAIQKVNLTLVANTIKYPTVLTLLARGVQEFPAGAWARGDSAAKYYRTNAVMDGNRGGDRQWRDLSKVANPGTGVPLVPPPGARRWGGDVARLSIPSIYFSIFSF